MDFVDKSRVQGNMNLLNLAEELKAKIRALAGSEAADPLLSALLAPTRPDRPDGRARRCDVVVIGTSTGGPPALQAIIPRFPGGPRRRRSRRAAHARRASRARSPSASTPGARCRVREAQDGETVEAGHGPHRTRRHPHEAPEAGGRRARRTSTTSRGRAFTVRPSTSLMSSAARVYGAKVLGVLLTGMGADGVEGSARSARPGGRTLAESEETCVIYGMPKAAVEAGVVDRSVPLTEMADEILAAV